ncbi:MAG: gamma carbonic anhydrase family protein [Sphaerobacter sp.]|nr:gamma carbonic anhydrase family protein [Sphaerobacter sp.]
MALILPFSGSSPTIAADAFVAPTAVIIGDVEIASGASIWFGAVLRGDVGPIRVGPRANVQDGVIVHLDPGYPCFIGADVTIGHGAIIHGTVIGDGAQVGMGAILLTGSKIGPGAIVAAGALVPEGAEIPAGAVAMGVPARVRRAVTPEEARSLLQRAATYAARGALYREVIEAPQPAPSRREGVDGG